MKGQTKPDNFIQQLPLEATKNSDFLGGKHLVFYFVR